MKLWCSKCHTQWTEAVLQRHDKCPFTDCDGRLRDVPPTPPAPAKPERPTFPLFGGLK